MIEVGWDPDLEEDDPSDTADEERETETAADLLQAARGASEPDSQDDTATPNQPEAERLADHYAALQAWEEWSRNQGRSEATWRQSTSRHESESEHVATSHHHHQDATEDELDRTDLDASPSLEDRPAGATSATLGPNVWAEDQHEHAPYGPLFFSERHLRDQES